MSVAATKSPYHSTDESHYDTKSLAKKTGRKFPQVHWENTLGNLVGNIALLRSIAKRLTYYLHVFRTLQFQNDWYVGGGSVF